MPRVYRRIDTILSEAERARARERELAKWHRRRQNPESAGKIRAIQRAQSKRRWSDPAELQRLHARTRIAEALKSGRLMRGSCAICGAANAQAHHPDYERPLFIVWLCKSDHYRLHRLIRDGQTDEAAAIEAHAAEQKLGRAAKPRVRRDA